MILTNIDYVPGYEVTEALGVVKGSTIRARHLGQDIISVFRQIVGGELKEYGDMISESRKLSTSKMVADAEGLGAEAIINVRFATSSVMSGAAEILVYGTAVKLKKK